MDTTERLGILGLNGMLNICYLLSSLAPSGPILRRALLSLASNAGISHTPEILSITVTPDLPSELRIEVIHTLLDCGVESRQIASRLGSTSWDVICAIGTGLIQSGLPKTLIAEFGAAVARNTAYIASAGKESAHALPSDQGLSMLLQTAGAFGKIAGTSDRMIGSPEARKQMALWESVATELPEEVRVANFDSNNEIPGAIWLLWLAHLCLGDVTSESWHRYILWRTSYTPDSTIMDVWEYCTDTTSPVLKLLVASNDLEDLESLHDIAITFGGFAGFREWVSRVTYALSELRSLPSKERARLLRFGLGILQEEQRQVVESLLTDLFDPRVQPIALESIHERITSGELSVNDFQRVSEWFAHLEPGSVWRREAPAYRTIANAVGHRLVTSGQMDVYLPILSGYRLVQLAVLIASKGSENSADLRRVLLQPQLIENLKAAESTYIPFPPDQLRTVILSLISLVRDADSRVGDIASLLITGVCRSLVQLGMPRSPFRSPILDVAQAELAESRVQYRRAAGIALYVVRPPRSSRDWRRVDVLLQEATRAEVESLWTWVIQSAADLANQPERWAREINAILQAGTSDEIFVIMSDVLRSLLQRHSQSLADQALSLGLPQTS